MDTQITLFSQFSPKKKAKELFRERLKECIWLKASTAYWTILPDYFGKDLLLDVLKRKDSFFCVHFEYPTNWKNIQKLVEKGANMFLHYHKLVGTNSINLRTPLLHAKVNLFALPNGKAEIWVGSYNMTNKALTDINIESATIIRTTQTSSIYKQTLAFLEGVRKKCKDFDERKMLAYEFSRKQNLLSWGKENIAKLFNLPLMDIGHVEKSFIIRLTGHELHDLTKTASILQIICMGNLFFRRALSKLEETLIIEAWDPDRGKIYLYKARILLTGLVNELQEETYDMRFSQRRFAVIEKDKVGGVLEKEEVITEKHLRQAALFATLVIEDKMGTLNIYDTPKVWGKVAYEEHLNSKSANIKEQNREIEELILDVKTLDYPEAIQPIPLEGMEVLLEHYRLQLGLSSYEAVRQNYRIDINYFSDYLKDDRALEKRFVIERG